VRGPITTRLTLISFVTIYPHIIYHNKLRHIAPFLTPHSPANNSALVTLTLAESLTIKITFTNHLDVYVYDHDDTLYVQAEYRLEYGNEMCGLGSEPGFYGAKWRLLRGDKRKGGDFVQAFLRRLGNGKVKSSESGSLEGKYQSVILRAKSNQSKLKYSKTNNNCCSARL
jgi:hypothetical protein